MHISPVVIDTTITIGASGAVSSFTNSGNLISSITRLSAGTYQVQLKDPYAKLLAASGYLVSPATGSAITAGSFVSGTLYQIVSLGTTNFNSVGLPANLTPAVGQVFVATGVGSGTGTVKAVSLSGINNVELASPLMNATQAQNGSYLIMQCQGPTSGTSTVPKATDPTQGSLLVLEFYMNNSGQQ